MPVDLRFYSKRDAYNLGQLAALCGGELVKGDATACPKSPASASNAGPDEICFFEGRAKDTATISEIAGFCIVKDNLVEKLADGEMALITHPDPRWAHVLVCKALFTKKDWREDGTATLDATAHIHPSAQIDAGADIGANTVIGPHVYIGPGVKIGANCMIEAGVSIECALIGQGVTLSPGVRIGQAGFGVLAGPEGPEDIPHWGRVIIGDDVSIGAGSCVDRGVFDDTIIGARTKIDNMCQVAHNVVMGRNVLMACYAGISGSCTIGDNVTMGGGVGIADHLTIGDGVTILARSGLMHNVPDGERWGGYPARPWREWLRESAWLTKQVQKKSDRS